MTAKPRSPRQRLAGENLIGFDTSVWKNLPKRDVKSDAKGQRSKILAAKAGVKNQGQRSKILAAKAGPKPAWRKQNATN